MLPACAGMILTLIEVLLQEHHAPRVCGDDPAIETYLYRDI